MDYSYCPIVLFTNRVMIERPDYEFSDKEKALIIQSIVILERKKAIMYRGKTSLEDMIKKVTRVYKSNSEVIAFVGYDTKKDMYKIQSVLKNGFSLADYNTDTYSNNESFRLVDDTSSLVFEHGCYTPQSMMELL